MDSEDRRFLITQAVRLSVSIALFLTVFICLLALERPVNIVAATLAFAVALREADIFRANNL